MLVDPQTADGGIAIFESTVMPDEPTPLHLHRSYEEAFYVLSGASVALR